MPMFNDNFLKRCLRNHWIFSSKLAETRLAAAKGCFTVSHQRCSYLHNMMFKNARRGRRGVSLILLSDSRLDLQLPCSTSFCSHAWAPILKICLLFLPLRTINMTLSGKRNLSVHKYMLKFESKILRTAWHHSGVMNIVWKLPSLHPGKPVLLWFTFTFAPTLRWRLQWLRQLGLIFLNIFSEAASAVRLQARCILRTNHFVTVCALHNRILLRKVFCHSCQSLKSFHWHLICNCILLLRGAHFYLLFKFLLVTITHVTRLRNWRFDVSLYLAATSYTCAAARCNVLIRRPDWRWKRRHCTNMFSCTAFKLKKKRLRHRFRTRSERCPNEVPNA